MRVLENIDALSNGLRTFDSVYYNGIISSIRDMYSVECDDGHSYIPCALVYFLDESGTRKSKLFPGTFKRDLFNYYEDGMKLLGSPLSDNLIFDPISQQYLIVMPIEDHTFFEYDELPKKLPKNTPVVFKSRDGLKWAE